MCSIPSRRSELAGRSRDADLNVQVPVAFEGARDQAGALRLFEHETRAVAVGPRGNREVRANVEPRELRRLIQPVQRSARLAVE